MKQVLWGGALALLSVQVAAETPNGVLSSGNNTQLSQPVIDHNDKKLAKSHAGVDDAFLLDDRALSTPSEHPFPLALRDGTDVDLTSQLPRFYTDVRPPARSSFVPRTRWQHMRGHEVWTRAALSALKEHGKPLVNLVPGDIETWCPAYKTATDRTRGAFWVGFLSALAKHESTHKPWAVGGGGKWYGLLQILPGTARGYKCNARTGGALKNGAANLSCAVRIMAVTVPRDGVIYGRGGRGVAADWGPMRSAAKRREMAGWLRRQNYCKPANTTRPKERP